VSDAEITGEVKIERVDRSGAVVDASRERFWDLSGDRPSQQITPELAEFRDTVRRFAAERVAPRARQIDEEDTFPWDVWEALRGQGLLHFGVPNEFGGSGNDTLATCVAMEALAAESVAVAMMMAPPGAFMLAEHGSAEQKARYFPKIAALQCPTAVGITEPGAGSDVSAMTTRATRSGAEWVLNGRKCFITNAGVADPYFVFAKTNAGGGRDGIGLFVVDADTPGFSVPRLEQKMGQHGSNTGDLLFDDARVPVTNCITEHDGFRVAMTVVERDRPLTAALALGLLWGAVSYTVAYARDRQQFGRSISSFQAIQAMVADMVVALEAGRVLNYRACRAVDLRHPNAGELCAMTKVYCTDAAMRAMTNAVQILGGHGYMRDHPVERMMRDAKILQIYGGTNQIQRLILQRALLQIPRSMAANGSTERTTP
jgi:alkylation response protein AidB-like acyl-CoA dehydrogenase